MTKAQYIKPQWPAPIKICAYSTTRLGGVSCAPYNQLNLSLSSKDSRTNVLQNREILAKDLQLPSQPIWKEQIHSNICINADNPQTQADAIYSNKPNQVCLIQTADCLPILLCNQAGTEVAAIHAGWRGLAAGIITNTLAHFSSNNEQLLAWLGPSIGPEKFEVGDDVKQAFLNQNPANETAFKSIGNDKYLANIYMLANMQLRQAGISSVYCDNHCTYSDQETFFSYRRDGETGRMASLIWIKE